MKVDIFDTSGKATNYLKSIINLLELDIKIKLENYVSCIQTDLIYYYSEK